MNKSVVITGGNRGIGLSLSRVFLAAGYHVVVGSRSPGQTAELGDRAVFVETDVRTQTDHIRLVEIAKKQAPLTTYINNAGYSAWASITDIDEAFLEGLISTNLKGAFWGCKAAAAALTTGGNIINMSSMAGKRGSAANAAYCATKFGMNGLTQSLAKELGPRGIRVNAICPVLVRTEGLMDALADTSSPAGGDPEGFLDAFRIGQSALKRLPTPEEVANYAVWLASDAASAMTGQCVNVDCGVFPQ